MRRPRVVDHASEQRLRRQRSFGTAAALTACVALVLLCTQGGMLYDRVSASSTTALLPAIAVPLGGLLVAIAACLWALTDSRPATLRWSWVSAATVSLILLSGWVAVRWFGTPDRLTGYVNLIILLTAAGIAVIIGAQHANGRLLSAAVVALVLSSLILAVVGIREYLAELVAGNPGWRVFAGFAVPNFLAGFMVSVLPVVVALLLGVRDRLGSVVIGLALVLQTVTMLLTQSRLGVAALGIGAVVWTILLVYGGLLRGVVARRALVILAIILVAGGVASGPVVRRLKASRDQSYSARFRVMTWQGAVKLVRERPFLGSGTGSFDAAYPRYAIVGYTQHAHNSFLQWACETGLPGVALLIIALGGAVLSGITAVRAAHPDGWTLGDERLVASGLAAGMVAAAAHNVFDSDLYVPANMAALAAIGGLLVAMGRRANPIGRTAHPSAKGITIARTLWGALVIASAVVLFLMAGRLLVARTQTVVAARALLNQDVIGALDAYRAAAHANPLDPEPLLAMAAIHDRLNEGDAALAALKEAVRVAPCGKTYYRLGKYLITAGRAREAVRALERARAYDPRHLRTLLALAEAYRASGRGSEADRVYEQMVALYRSPVGQVRAIPEVVDWEYGVAFAALAERPLAAERFAEAESNLERADEILSELWRTRREPMVQVRVPPDALREASARYEWVLSQRAACLARLGRDGEAADVTARLRRLREDLEKEAGSAP